MPEYQLTYTGAKVQEILDKVDKKWSVWDGVTKLREDFTTAQQSAPRSLWNGSWLQTSGTITVSGINDYSVFAVVFNNAFCVKCFKSGTNIKGGGSWITTEGDMCNTHVEITTAGETLSIKSIVHVVSYCPSERLSSSREELPITEIIGIE